MTNKKSAGNRVFMANLGKAGTFALNCGHRELKQIESLLGVKITDLSMDSVRTIDCCLYCMVQRDAARKGAGMDKDTFNAALDSLNAAQYLAASRAAAECFKAAFDVPLPMVTKKTPRRPRRMGLGPKPGECFAAGADPDRV